MFENRLRKRYQHLKKWAKRTGVGAFRLYTGDIPEIPLVLDFYGDVTNPQEAALSGALYSRPYEKDEAEEEKWLSAMKESAALSLGVVSEKIFLKRRQKQKGRAQYEKMGGERFEKIVSEGDLSFKVNLSDYLDTGLFPDRRLLRAMVRKEVSSAAPPPARQSLSARQTSSAQQAKQTGKRVLNLFSYTGSFSVYAAAGGAACTDSVDLSNTYLAWARENFSLNGFSARIIQQWDFFSDRGQRQRDGAEERVNTLVRADALDFIAKAADSKIKWDIIILDPPSFSNSKKMADNFDLQRDRLPLVRSCVELLSPGGKLFLSVNTQKLRNAADITLDLSMVSDKLRVVDLTEKVIDEDFKGKKSPYTYLIYL
jgi:23S rRNA G2069 N7-methylase RlmK/C1962 C5-methylase RlmI